MPEAGLWPACFRILQGCVAIQTVTIRAGADRIVVINNGRVVGEHVRQPCRQAYALQRSGEVGFAQVLIHHIFTALLAQFRSQFAQRPGIITRQFIHLAGMTLFRIMSRICDGIKEVSNVLTEKGKDAKLRDLLAAYGKDRDEL